MENTAFKRLLKEIRDGIDLNKNVLDEAINEAMEEGEVINLNKLIELIDSYENIEAEPQEGKSIAALYSGRPEITLTYMLDSILYNNKVTLCAEQNKPITEIFYTILKESLVELKLKNEWVEYSSDYDEFFLRENENKFDKIVYVGDYFEYEKFKSFFKKEPEYNNFGYIKLFMDKVKYQEEYKKIIKYTYVENIALDVYNNADDFIKESKKEDFSVIYANSELADTIKDELKSEEILVNTFPYESYKFKIKR